MELFKAILSVIQNQENVLKVIASIHHKLLQNALHLQNVDLLETVVSHSNVRQIMSLNRIIVQIFQVSVQQLLWKSHVGRLLLALSLSLSLSLQRLILMKCFCFMRKITELAQDFLTILLFHIIIMEIMIFGISIQGG